MVHAVSHWLAVHPSDVEREQSVHDVVFGFAAATGLMGNMAEDGPLDLEKGVRHTGLGEVDHQEIGCDQRCKCFAICIRPISPAVETVVERDVCGEPLTIGLLPGSRYLKWRVEVVDVAQIELVARGHA